MCLAESLVLSYGTLVNAEHALRIAALVVR
jgi:hypothetical protein